jgi:hypothetical protein
MATPTPRDAPSPPSPAATDAELHWFRTVYQGDRVPQFTLRAWAVGSLLGGVMSLSNLHVSGLVSQTCPMPSRR